MNLSILKTLILVSAILGFIARATVVLNKKEEATKLAKRTHEAEAHKKSSIQNM